MAGVTPKDMFRHILGEDLNVGCVLSWGPCWYFQKQFFEGKVNSLSQKDYLMRYDVEVSGFPSQHAGHLCLLRLKEDDYPKTTRIEEWPSWDLPILKWGKEQGGVVGFSHSGWGLEVKTNDLPNYKIPPFNGIGANEYIVDVVHDVVDFISSVDTPYVGAEHPVSHPQSDRPAVGDRLPCIYGEKAAWAFICKARWRARFRPLPREIQERLLVRRRRQESPDRLRGECPWWARRGASSTCRAPTRRKVTASVAARCSTRSPIPGSGDRPYPRGRTGLSSARGSADEPGPSSWW
jgi:hypothetical protein